MGRDDVVQVGLVVRKKTGKWKLNIVQNIVEIQAKDAKKENIIASGCGACKGERKTRGGEEVK